MPGMLTSALVRLYRIQRRLSTVSLATHAEVLAPTGQLLLASGPRSPSGAELSADATVGLTER